MQRRIQSASLGCLRPVHRCNYCLKFCVHFLLQNEKSVIYFYLFMRETPWQAAINAFEGGVFYI